MSDIETGTATAIFVPNSENRTRTKKEQTPKLCHNRDNNCQKVAVGTYTGTRANRCLVVRKND